MAARTFAQINCSILNSQKLKTLGHRERWAYMCVHLTPLSNFSGMFRYPSVMWAHDAGVSLNKFNDVLASLINAGLIEHDATEEIVWIVGFHRQRPPDNASKCISLIADFSSDVLEDQASIGMQLRCIAEFVVAALKRAQRWKPDSSEWPKLREAMKPFLRTIYQNNGERFLEAMQREAECSDKATLAELQSLLPPLSAHHAATVSAPCPHGGGIRDLDETRPRQDKDENKDKDENDTAKENGSSELQCPSSLESPDSRRKSASTTGNPARIGPREETKQSRLAQGSG